MYTENGNSPHGFGVLDSKQFRPYSKNPSIAKVFREVSLADELGSGMRNTYKYTQLYSRAEPKFIEGDLFTIIIPLRPVMTDKVGPTPEVTPEVTPEDSMINKILLYCSTPKSRKEIMDHCGYSDYKNFTKKFINTLLESGKLKMTVPDKPTSSKQKYIKA